MFRLLLNVTMLLALCLTNQASAEPLKDPGKAAMASFRQRFPALNAQSATPTPVAGLFEVQLPDRIVYFSPASGHLLVGELWSPQGHNLTRERQAAMMAERIKGLPLDQAIKIGSGKHTVIEVSDPDCPFCRQGDAFLTKRTDLTRYVFLLPLPMHPNAAKKASYILSSNDPAAAYLDVMSGKFDRGPLPAFTDNGRLERHRKVAEKLGVRGTPNYWIDGVYLSGADIKAMEQLLR